MTAPTEGETAVTLWPLLGTDVDRLSMAVEDYLKMIFHLRVRRGHAAVSTIAEELGVTAASVSAMVKRLEALGLVTRGDRREVALTSAGERQALGVVRRHRLLETFLWHVLGLGWDEVHAEAEVLEHVVTEGVEARIDELLGHPSHDPHGDPIPPKDGPHDEDWHDPLDAVPVGRSFRVERVSDRDSDALRYLARQGIGPGTMIAVRRRDPFGGPLWVSVDGVEHPLGAGLTRLVHGRVLAPVSSCHDVDDDQ